MIYGLTRTVGPATEPVTLAEAKLHLRIDHALDDDLINTLIAAAREFCEDYQGKAYVTQTWTLTLDAFPSGEIAIPRPPLQSATIAYDDIDNVNQAVPPATYVVDISSDQGGRIALAYGASWPLTYDEVWSVVVTFVAGYGTAASASAQVKAAIIAEIPMAINALLGPRSVIVAG